MPLLITSSITYSITLVTLGYVYFPCSVSPWLLWYYLKDSNTLESFIVFFISVLSLLLFFFFRTRDWNRKSPKLHHIQTPLIYGPLSDDVHKSVSVSIQITVLDLEPNPCFQIFLNISETNGQIFNCNISKRSSGQELPFIFFELGAPTCLWGRYGPKLKILHFLAYISSTSTPFQKHFTPLHRATPVLHFMFWLLRCMLWLERIMSPNLKFLSLLKHYRKSP